MGGGCRRLSLKTSERLSAFRPMRSSTRSTSGISKRAAGFVCSLFLKIQGKCRFAGKGKFFSRSEVSQSSVPSLSASSPQSPAFFTSFTPEKATKSEGMEHRQENTFSFYPFSTTLHRKGGNRTILRTAGRHCASCNNFSHPL